MRAFHPGWLLAPAAIIVVGLALFAVRGPQAGSAFTLSVGDCFDMPAAATVSDVDLRPCTTPHDGEVFYVEDDSTTPVWPGVEAFQNRVSDACVGTAFEPYVGASYGSRQDLKVGYFFPPEEAWASGQRRLTCYVSPSDGSKLTASVRATP